MQENPFTFTKELQSAVRQTKWNDVMSQSNKEIEPKMIQGAKPIEGHRFPLKHNKMCMYQLENTLYYLFSCQDREESSKAEFTLHFYNFNKDNGEHQCCVLRKFKGTVSCLSLGLTSTSYKANGSQKPRQSYNMAVFVGLKQGFIKIIEFVPNSQGGMKIDHFSHKIDQKKVIQVIVPQRQIYPQNICLILLQDCKVFLLNYRSKQIVAVFQPPMLAHDLAIGISLHMQGRFFATSSESGQIVFWEISSNIKSAIVLSEQKGTNNTEKKEWQDTQVQQQTWLFKSKDKIFSVFPASMLHAASVNGLKWMEFMGNLVALITRQGVFKLIAVDFGGRDEFITLIQYRIPNGEAISNVRIYAQQETIVVFKAKDYVKLVKNQFTAKQQQVLQWRQNALKKRQRWQVINRNCIQPAHGVSSIQKIRFGSVMRVFQVQKESIVDDKGQLVSYNRGMISDDMSVVVVADENGFYIGKIV